jgi:SAM-dependent methyltransferase
VDQDEVDWINLLRAEEISTVLLRVSRVGGNLLEIGGGTGYQASLLAKHGVNVISIDVDTSNYRHARVFPVLDYDGRNIPFPDKYFDIVFSSNTLEHVRDLHAFEVEIQRVLKQGGRAIHVLPSHHWRFWSWWTHYPGVMALLRRRLRGQVKKQGVAVRASGVKLAMKVLVPPRHGERGNSLTEYWYFRPSWWTAHFVQSGWQVLQVFELGLFYTGYMLLRCRFSLNMRRRVAQKLGSASICYVLEKKPDHLPRTTS